MSFVADSRVYKARIWWCGICRQRTPTELNPEWVADGKPLKFDKKYEWFARCGYCQTGHYTGGYDCDRCGRPSESPEGPCGKECLACGQSVDAFEARNEACAYCGAPPTLFKTIYYNGTMIEMTKPEYNIMYSINYGVTGYDWDEKHRCPSCRHIYWIRNGSC